MLYSRLVTFYRSLINTTKFQVRFLARLNENYMRTVLGRNLYNLLDKCGLQHLDDLHAKLVKQRCKYFVAPAEEL